MSSYYYSDSQQKPVGPLTLDALRALRAAGVVRDNTSVIEEGGAQWRSYLDVTGSTASTPAGGYTPPAPPRPALGEDAVRERVAAVADRTAAAAGATAKVVQASVLQTFRAANTIADKAVVFGAAAGIIAFFLPWAGAFGGNISGFGLAQQVTGLLWLLPLSLGATCFLCYLNVGATKQQRVLRARVFLAVGTFWAAIALLATVGGRNLFGVASIGLYLTLLAAIAMAAGGFVQIAENLAQSPGGSDV